MMHEERENENENKNEKIMSLDFFWKEKIKLVSTKQSKESKASKGFNEQ